MYSALDAERLTRYGVPSFFFASCTPRYARWLKPRSLSPPTSVTRPTLNDDVLAPPPPPDDFFEPPPPHPATRTTSNTVNPIRARTVTRPVLDCKAKTWRILPLAHGRRT